MSVDDLLFLGGNGACYVKLLVNVGMEREVNDCECLLPIVEFITSAQVNFWRGFTHWCMDARRKVIGWVLITLKMMWYSLLGYITCRRSMKD